MMQEKQGEGRVALLHKKNGVRKYFSQARRRAEQPPSAGRRSTDETGARAVDAERISADERQDLIAGLTAPSARISSKYFYDSLGSRLFEAITHLPEYYPTRTEASIFARHAGEIAQATGTGTTLIDLGAGNCEKARALFGALRPSRYVAVDISADYLRDALSCLQHRHPDIAMTALGLDMSAGVALPGSVPAGKRLFFFPGSSIGNLTPEDAQEFLAGLRGQCDDDGGLLIGVDLVKEKSIIDAAYDDTLGVTAAFNLNALSHVNAVLGSDFDLRDWRHCGFFDAELSRVEMHVETRLEVEVTWPGGSRHFEAGERIHTENSYKYRLQDFSLMLQRAGFRNVSSWTDQRNWFAVCYASAD
jgi:dimethylhistidine N-methyltransferase